MKAEDLQKLTEEILRMLTVSFGAVTATEKEPGEWEVTVESDESGLLIGPRGAHFMALSHLVRKMAAKKFGEDQKVSLDVNDYRRKASEELKHESEILFERARS